MSYWRTGIPHSVTPKPDCCKRKYLKVVRPIKSPLVPVADVIEMETMHTQYFSQMNDFRKNGKYCDLDIIIGKKIFPCHRVILASSSSYFDGMLGGLFVESKQRQITLDSVNASCFENILDFVYTKKVAISEINAYDLLTASRYFNLNHMEDFCVQYMTKNLPQKQIFEICAYANLTGKKELYDTALKYIAENFATLSKKEEFLMLPFDILEAVVQHKNLERVDDLILDLIVRWKNAGYGFEDQVRSLLKNVMTGGVTSDYLAKFISNDDHTPRLSIRVVHVEDSKHKMMKFEYKDANKQWIPDVEYSREKVYERSVLIHENIFTLSCSGWIQDENKIDQRVAKNEFVVEESRKVSVCEHVNQQKQRLKEPPVNVSSYILSAIHNTIYLHVTDSVPKSVDEVSLISKAKDQQKSTSLFAYVYDLDEWFAIPKPKVDVIGSCMATMNNLLYSVGGSKCCEPDLGFYRKGYAQCYDPRMCTWIPLPEMPHPHCNGAACSYNGKLYVVGGDLCKILEVFDPVAGRWAELMAPTYGHSSFSLVEFKNSLWAIGNRSSKGVLTERYYPKENVWTNDNPAILELPVHREVRVVDAIVI